MEMKPALKTMQDRYETEIAIYSFVDAIHSMLRDKWLSQNDILDCVKFAFQRYSAEQLKELGIKFTPEEKSAIKEAIPDLAKKVSGEIGAMLKQEYKMHNGEMWLWALGKPIRPLTDEEQMPPYFIRIGHE